jgi:hypothetical protein
MEITVNIPNLTFLTKLSVYFIGMIKLLILHDPMGIITLEGARGGDGQIEIGAKWPT